MCGSRRLFPITGTFLADLQRGDNRAWDRLFTQESPCLKAWLKSRIPEWLQRQQPAQGAHGGIVEDLAQDTWLIVLRSVVGSASRSVLHHTYVHPAFDSPIGRKPKSAAEFVLLSRLRRERRQVDRAAGSVEAERDPISTLEARAHAGNLDEHLDAAKPPLTELERTVVELRLEEGQTFQEIADAMSLTLGQVTAAWYRAMRNIAAGDDDVDDRAASTLGRS